MPEVLFAVCQDAKIHSHPGAGYLVRPGPGQLGTGILLSFTNISCLIAHFSDARHDAYMIVHEQDFDLFRFLLLFVPE